MAGRSRNPSPSAHTHTAHRSQEWRGKGGARTQTHTYPETPARSGGTQPKPEFKHAHPNRTPQPGVAGYKSSAHTNKHTPQHPSQEWRDAAKTRAQAHTPTSHSPARSGRYQAEHAHKHTHNPTPKPLLAARSQTRAHAHTPTPQEWRGTGRASTQTHTHTHPNTPAINGGAQLKPHPKRTHPHCTPQPGVAG